MGAILQLLFRLICAFLIFPMKSGVFGLMFRGCRSIKEVYSSEKRFRPTNRPTNFAHTQASICTCCEVVKLGAVSRLCGLFVHFSINTSMNNFSRFEDVAEGSSAASGGGSGPSKRSRAFHGAGTVAEMNKKTEKR